MHKIGINSRGRFLRKEQEVGGSSAANLSPAVHQTRDSFYTGARWFALNSISFISPGARDRAAGINSPRTCTRRTAKKRA